MLVIRYFRIGKRNQPNFKIVVTDKRRPAKGGRFLEELGTYDPIKKRKALKADRIKYWLSVGAQSSDTVHNLLVSEKIIEGRKIDVHKEKKAKEETSATENVAPAAPAEKKAAESKPAEEAKPKTEEKPVEPPKEEDVSSEALAKEEPKKE